MSGNLPAYVSLSLAMIIVGSSVVCGKIITLAFPVFLASGIRFALASLIMVPLALRQEGGLPAFNRRDWITLAVMAFCGQFMFTCLLLFGLRLTSAANAGLITSTTPAAMALLAMLLLKERPQPAMGAAVILAVAGVLMVNGGFGLAGGGDNGDQWLGNLLICCAVLGEAVFLLLRRRFPISVSEITLTAALCFLGLVMFLPLAIYEAISFDFSAPGADAWWAMAYFGLVFTVVAYILWFKGVARVPGTVAGVFTSLLPLTALTLSVTVLGEPLAAGQLIGGGLVLAAILCATLCARRGPARAKA